MNKRLTKYLCILVPASLFLYLVPYLYQFSALEYISAENAKKMHFIESKFCITMKQIGARNALSDGGIFDEI